MKHYLNLVPISARVHKRQNHMTILCIIFAVFLVTAVFSVADMMIRTESGFILNKHGNWHIQLENITRDAAEEIGERSDVAAVGAAAVFNFDGGQPYRINEKRAVLYGTEETYMDQISGGIAKGNFPRDDEEVMLSPNAAEAFGAQIGDQVILHTPSGDQTFTVSGFGTDDEGYYEGQTYLIGVYMTQRAFSSLLAENGVTDKEPVYYVQFEDAAKAAKAIKELQSQYQLPAGSISENTGVMGMAGQSDSTVMKNIYGIAAVLFVLVLLAGVLMISGSMNSNVAQRTQFFGMMRCIGASRRQIIRFVRLEALNWCKTAIPAGVIFGTVISWGICGALHYGIGGEFATTPVFKISPVGLVSGTAVGIITVIMAAQSPAKRAARVSPMSAVSGNTENGSYMHHAVRMRPGKIDRSLGIWHAVGTKKNWCLITASFALTIILFFSFSVIMDLARLLMPSLNAISADIVLNGYGNALIFDRELVDEIKEIKGVETVYGCSYMDHIPTASSREGVDYIDMVSYDDSLLKYAEKSVAQGNLDEIAGNSSKVATVCNKDNPLKVGDRLQVAGEEVEISCALSQGLFGDGRIIICSQETFDRLMGDQKYGLIGVQLEKDAAEETVARIRSLENDDTVISDLRESNQQNTATYYASRIVCYGFLTILGIIAWFNIVNSISMSVSARTKQYGAMRAVGMDAVQLKRMIAAESFTYAVSGLIVGSGVGIPLSRFLYIRFITHYFGVQWHLPVVLLGIVAVFVFASASAAVYAPSKRIRNMAITDIIKE